MAIQLERDVGEHEPAMRVDHGIEVEPCVNEVVSI